MEKKKLTHIDVESVLKAKAPKKRIPKFLINYLKKIIHQDEVNEFFVALDGKENADFMEGALDRFEITRNIIGTENLPDKNDGKRYIFASNHPLGGMDGMVMGSMLGERYDDKVKVFVNDILMFLEPMQGMFLPINKHGGQNRDNAKMIDDFYKSDYHMVTFPAGVCSRLIKGKIQDFEWKKNFIVKAVKHQRDIVPVFFEGRNSNFYYNLSKWRMRFGVKLNLEMFYLSDEMFKQQGKTFTLKIGKPIPWQTFDKSKTPTEWAAWVRETVYKMR